MSSMGVRKKVAATHRFGPIGLADRLYDKLLGQDEAINEIVPYIDTFHAGLSPDERPAGIFLLLGGTGTGKTYSVESIAQQLHGDKSKILTIHCGEFQMEHEVAKLIGCFTPETKVLMGDGSRKSIVDIEIGDNVITKHGRVRPVGFKHEFDHDGEILELHTYFNNVPVKCTPQHKILSIKIGANGRRIRNPRSQYDVSKLEWHAASELQKGDIVAYPRYQETSIVESIDLDPYIRDMVGFTVTDTAIINHVRTLNRHIVVNNDFMRLAGYYVADGGKDSEGKGISITFGIVRKQPAIKDAINLIKKVFGEDTEFKIEDRSENGSVRLNFSSSIAHNLFVDLFGDHTHRKKVPEWFLGLSDELLYNFVDAALMGDGGRTVPRRLDYSTTSPILQSQMELIFRRLGYATQMQANAAEKEGWQPRYRIYVAGEQIDKLAANLPMVGPGVDLGDGSIPVIQRSSFVDDKYVYFRVQKVIPKHYSGKVYDISVGEDTSYVVENITVKNSPPGYLGHKETVAYLNNDAITKIKSQYSTLSLVLFDEIEKAASSMVRLLLGILDKGVIRTGDGSTVKFQDSLIFMTSNLGADESRKFLSSTFGFSEDRSQEFKDKNLKRISDKALAKKFSPEFINRIDAKISYRSLTKDDVRDIIDREVEVLQELIFTRLGEGGFLIKLTDSAKELVLENGFSEEYGARNIKRYIQKNILQPISALFNAKELKPGQLVTVDSEDGELILEF